MAWATSHLPHHARCRQPCRAQRCTIRSDPAAHDSRIRDRSAPPRMVANPNTLFAPNVSDFNLSLHFRLYTVSRSSISDVPCSLRLPPARVAPARSVHFWPCARSIRAWAGNERTRHDATRHDQTIYGMDPTDTADPARHACTARRHAHVVLRAMCITSAPLALAHEVDERMRQGHLPRSTVGSLPDLKCVLPRGAGTRDKR